MTSQNEEKLLEIMQNDPRFLDNLAKNIATVINMKAGVGTIGFALFVFPIGNDSETTTYVSNCQRQGVIDMLETWLKTVKQKPVNNRPHKHN